MRRVESTRKGLERRGPPATEVGVGTRPRLLRYVTWGIKATYLRATRALLQGS